MQPEAILASGRVALPLVDDPLAALADGFRIKRTELAGILRRGVESGDLLGVWAEANPNSESWHEHLVEGRPPPGPMVRWRAEFPNGGCLASVLLPRGTIGFPAGTPAEDMTKCGFPCSGRGPLEPSADRTYLVEGPPAPGPDHPAALTLVHLLSGGYLPDFDENLWVQLSRAWGHPPRHTQTAMREILMSRVIRRFALLTSMNEWTGCGMARWVLRDPAQAPAAAGALARLAGTGDVAVRPGGVVTAIFLSRQPAGGEAAAREVARQWGLPLDRWQELRLS